MMMMMMKTIFSISYRIDVLTRLSVGRISLAEGTNQPDQNVDALRFSSCRAMPSDSKSI